MLKVNKSQISYCDKKLFVSDYNDYIVSLLERVIKNNNLEVNIDFIFFSQEKKCDSEYFKNNNQIIKIICNYEHTLVKPNGRHTSQNEELWNVYEGNVMDYLVRILLYKKLIDSNIIIDYSFHNIYNIWSGNNDELKMLYDKMILIYPSIYLEHELCKSIIQRSIPCLTTFYDTTQPRRNKLLQNLQIANIPNLNVNTCFDKNELQKLYLSTKIMINIHQTDEHNTLEEIRILPALQCGVIIISEKTQIKENKSLNVIYDDYIIWASYDEIIEKTKEVMDNYEKYFNEIFLKPKSVNLYELDALNYTRLEKSLRKFTNTHRV